MSYKYTNLYVPE